MCENYRVVTELSPEAKKLAEAAKLASRAAVAETFAAEMIKRFRMIAGPNGSGKSTLIGWLHDDYSVNFYTLLNADDIRRRRSFLIRQKWRPSEGPSNSDIEPTSTSSRPPALRSVSVASPIVMQEVDMMFRATRSIPVTFDRLVN